MTLLAPIPINRDAFTSAQRVPLDPSGRAQTDGGAATGAFPLDPVGLLGLFAGISALGLAHLASRGVAPSGQANGLTFAPTGTQQGSGYLGRQRYVSGIADQIGQDEADSEGDNQSRVGRALPLAAPVDSGPAFETPARQGDDQTVAPLPAVLRSSIVGGTGAQKSSVVPIQFSRIIPNPARVPFGVPGTTSDENQKKIERGLMESWNSLQERTGGLRAPSGTDDSGDAPAWLEATPLGVILGLIAEMARKSGGRKAKQGEIPFKLSPSITPPDGPDSKEACEKAANGTLQAWENYCRDVSADKTCWNEHLESAQRKRGWCANRFSE